MHRHSGIISYTRIKRYFRQSPSSADNPRNGDTHANRVCFQPNTGPRVYFQPNTGPNRRTYRECERARDMSSFQSLSQTKKSKRKWTRSVTAVEHGLSNEVPCTCTDIGYCFLCRTNRYFGQSPTPVDDRRNGNTHATRIYIQQNTGPNCRPQLSGIVSYTRTKRYFGHSPTSVDNPRKGDTRACDESELLFILILHLLFKKRHVQPGVIKECKKCWKDTYVRTS